MNDKDSSLDVYIDICEERQLFLVYLCQDGNVYKYDINHLGGGVVYSLLSALLISAPHAHDTQKRI